MGCKTGCRDDARPSSAPTAAYEALAAALALSVSLSYLPTLSLLFTRLAVGLQRAVLPSGKIDLYNTCALSPYLLFFSTSLLCGRTLLRLYCSTCSRPCQRRSPRRIPFSELAKRALASTKSSSIALQSGSTSNLRREELRARALGL